MGLFKEEKEYSGAAYSRVYKDNSIPYTVRSSICTSIVGHYNQQMIDRLISDIIIGPMPNYRQAFKFAGDSRNPLGNPNPQILKEVDALSDIKEYFYARFNFTETSSIYFSVGTYNYFQKVWEYLVNNYDYDKVTNSYNKDSIKYYLAKIEINAAKILQSDGTTYKKPSEYSTENLYTETALLPIGAEIPVEEIPTEREVVNYPENNNSSFTLTFIYKDADDSIKTVQDTIQLTTPDFEAVYFNVAYYYEDKLNFVSLTSDNSHIASLMKLEDIGGKPMRFAPYIHFKANGKDLVGIPNYHKIPDKYIALLKLLHMEEEVAEIQKAEQVAATTDADELDVLAKLTDEELLQLADASPNDETIWKAISTRTSDILGLDAININKSLKANENYGDFRDASMGWMYPIDSEDPVLTKHTFFFLKWIYQSTAFSGSTSLHFEDKVIDMELGLNSISYTNNITGKVADPREAVISLSGADVVVKHQIDEDTYEEVTATGLDFGYHIPGKWYGTSATDPDGDGKSKILIPVSLAIAEDMLSYPERETLYFKSQGLIITWYKETEVMRGWVGELLNAINVIISIASLSTGRSIVKTAASRAMSRNAVTQYINLAVNLAFSYYAHEGFNFAISELVKFLVKELGLKAAGILIAVLYIVGTIFGIVQPSQLVTFLMQAVNVAVQTIQQMLAKQLANLKKRSAQLSKTYSGKIAKLEKKLKKLDRSNYLNSYAIWNKNPYLMYPTTSVESYLQLKAHTTNPGVAALSYPSNYVDMQLNKRKL